MTPVAEATYWNGCGQFQSDYDALYAELVPQSGMCETTRGELLRAVSKLYYDYYNNGGCNLDNYRYEIEMLDEWRDRLVTHVKRQDFDWLLTRLRRHCVRVRRGCMYLKQNADDTARFRDTIEAVVNAAILAVKDAAVTAD